MKVTANRLDITHIEKELVKSSSFMDKVSASAVDHIHKSGGLDLELDENDFKPLLPKFEAIQAKALAVESSVEVLATLQAKGGAEIEAINKKFDGIHNAVEKSVAPAIAEALTKDKLIEALKSSVGRSVLTGVKGGTTLPLPSLRPVAGEYCSSTATSDLIRRSIKAGRHMMISGPAGSGKTYPLHQELNAVKRRHITVSCADGVSYGDLIVRQELRSTAKGNETIWRMGVLPFCMENGIALILDEVDQLAPELLQVLNACLESRELLIPTTGDVITAHKDWIVGVTLNSLRDDTGVYSGFRVDERTCQRFCFIPADYLPENEEIKVVQCATNNCPDAEIKSVVGAMSLLRAYHFAGRLRGAPSTRVAIKIIRMMNGLNDDNKKVDQPMDMAQAFSCCYLGGMPKTQTREAITCLMANGNYETLGKDLSKMLSI